MPTKLRPGTTRGRPWVTLLALLVSLVLVGATATRFVVPAYASETVLELAPTKMAYTDLANPNTAFDSAPTLSVSKTRYRTYITYDTAEVDRSATIVSAALDLTVEVSDATKPGLVVQLASPGWSGPELTHRSRPDATSEVLNPDDPWVPNPGTRISLALTDTAGITPHTQVGFVISYLRAFTHIEVSRAQAPTLRLTVRPVGPAEPGRERSTSLPYTVTPGSTKKVFAHYFPPYPISLDNEDPATDYYSTEYLNPQGEDGKFAAVGGFLRDRPIGRAPITTGDYELADAVTEVQQAKAAGIDGFMIDILSWTSANWTRSLRMTEAAARTGPGFVTIPNVDLTAEAKNASAATIAAKLNQFYSSPSAYQLLDGRYVLSSFKAEVRPAQWWQSVMTELEVTYGKRIAFVGVFLDLSETRIKEYAPISYALSIWGLRTPEAVATSPAKADSVRRAGAKWMAPIAVQDVRHAGRRYAEAGNTETLRASWQRAIAEDADLVQLITWNDYSESTHFAPSEAHRGAFLDVNGYYVQQFKLGAPPTLTGDEVVVSHRIQGRATAPTGSPAPMDWQLLGPLTPPRDTVEVLTMAQAPSSVTLQVGPDTTTFSVPSGLSTYVVPLRTGLVRAHVVRDGVTVAAVTSPHPVQAEVSRWDLQYYAASSRTG